MKYSTLIDYYIKENLWISNKQLRDIVRWNAQVEFPSSLGSNAPAKEGITFVLLDMVDQIQWVCLTALRKFFLIGWDKQRISS